MKKLIDQITIETRLRDNPYFVALREGRFDREDFLETQIQFFHAVSYFNRPMSLLASKIPNAEQRVAIVQNV